MTATAAPDRPWTDRLVRPTLPELWTFLSIALPVLASIIAPLPTVDLAYQLRAGADILDGNGIPAVDSWTFTAAGTAWLDQQWGAQAILAVVYRAAGWTGLAILRAALVGLIFGLLLVAIRVRQPRLGVRVGAWLTLGAFVVAAPALALRPQLLAMVCFALTLALLAGRRARPRLVWLVPLVTIAWANLHGSFVLAPVLVGLAWLEDLGERAPRADGTFLASLTTSVATLVTPFGLEAWRYAAGLAADAEVRSRVSEWQPTLPTTVPGLLFWASVIAVGVIVVALVRRRLSLPWPAALTLLAFAALGAVTGRGVAWWPAIATATVAGLLPNGGPARTSDRTAERRPPRGSRLNALVALALVAAAAAALPIWRPVDLATGAPRGLLAYAPAGITASLRATAGPDDRVWNPQVWGSWFEHAVPEPRYAFDSRIELISSATWGAGDRVLGAIGDWSGLLEQYGVTIVVVEGDSDGSLAKALAGDSRWRLEYADNDGSIWRRAPS